MENFRKSVSFLFFGVFFITFSMNVCAETVEEKKASANYDETFPVSEETGAVEEAPAVPQIPAEVQPAQGIPSPVLPASSCRRVRGTPRRSWALRNDCTALSDRSGSPSLSGSRTG